MMPARSGVFRTTGYRQGTALAAPNPAEKGGGDLARDVRHLAFDQPEELLRVVRVARENVLQVAIIKC
jgi:hypothetical protein